MSAQRGPVGRGSGVDTNAGVDLITSTMIAGWLGLKDSKMLPEKKYKINHYSAFLSLCDLFLTLAFCLFLRAHVVQHYDGFKASRISSRPVPSEGRQHGYMAMLDELTLEHATQDCSSLKNQLLRLKTLLQVRSTRLHVPKLAHSCTYACVNTVLQDDNTYTYTYKDIHMLGRYTHRHTHINKHRYVFSYVCICPVTENSLTLICLSLF